MFSNENITKLEGFYKEMHKVSDELTIEHNKALDESNEKMYKTMRKNPEGKEVEVELEGKTLWYELRNIGFESDAGRILKPQFPKVFELHEQHSKMVEDLNKWSKVELGVDPLAMTLLDVVKIAKGVVEASK